jgi:hypothetical protein
MPTRTDLTEIWPLYDLERVPPRLTLRLPDEPGGGDGGA